MATLNWHPLKKAQDPSRLGSECRRLTVLPKEHAGGRLDSDFYKGG
jgi:hypothetical protein